MCLSTVYKIEDGEERLACENVTSVDMDNGVIKLTDIMGNEVAITGILKNIDLVKNIIRINV